MKGRAKTSESVCHIEHRPPTAGEFEALIKAVGWDQYTNLDALPEAIRNSVFCVVAVRGKKIVGMGRLVGDGARVVYVQDLIVVPRYQRRGIGSLMLDHLLDYVNQHAPRKVYVHLFTDRTMDGFYRRFGFKGPEEPFYGMSVKKFDDPLGRKKAPNKALQTTRGDARRNSRRPLQAPASRARV